MILYKRLKKLKNKIFKISVILLCFYFIFKYLVDNDVVVKIISDADYVKISFIILLSLLLIFFYSNLIFVCLNKICNIKIPKSRWYLIYFNSQFLNSIPFFGIVYRAVQLKKFDLSYDKFIGIYLMIKWLLQAIKNDNRKVPVSDKLFLEINQTISSSSSKSLDIKNSNITQVLANRSNIHFRW